MTTNAWIVGAGASSGSPGKQRELTQARGRLLTRRVDGHHYGQFTLSGGVGIEGEAFDENAAIELRKSDLWVYRDDEQLARHRIIGRQVQADATKWTITYQTVDYRGLLLLAARFKGTIPTWTGIDQAVIAWQMVQHRQAQTGGNWGITNGIGSPAGQLRTETDLTAGKSIGEAIDAIAARDNGFDWQINTDLELDRWTPRRVRDNGVVLDYGGAVDAFSGSSPEWANDVIFTGSQDTTPEVATDAGAGSDERGLWSVFGSSPNMTDQTSLASAADGRLADALTLNHDWSVRLAPGRWGGDDELTLGDLVRLWLGPVGFYGVCRVMQMQHEPGENGVETVTLGLREEEP